MIRANSSAGIRLGIVPALWRNDGHRATKKVDMAQKKPPRHNSGPKWRVEPHCARSYVPALETGQHAADLGFKSIVPLSLVDGQDMIWLSQAH